MTRLILLSTGVTAIVLLGVMIDRQSHTPIERQATLPSRNLAYASGRVEGLTSEIELRPQLAGRVVEVLVEEGQVVDSGEVLLRLDDQQYRLEVKLAAAKLHLAEAQLQRVINGARLQERAEAAARFEAKLAELRREELSWQRISQLLQEGAVSRQQADDQSSLVDSLRGQVDAAKARLDLLEADPRIDEIRINEAQIEAAEANLDLANVQLQRTALRAAGRGTILKLHVESGELTGPESSNPAVVMADTSRMCVRAFVEDVDATRVRVGMEATVTVDGLPEGKTHGSVVRLSPRMSHKQIWTDRPTERQDTKTREVWIELNGVGTLVVGLRVDVVIDLDSVEEVP